MQLPFDLTIETSRKQAVTQQLCKDTRSGDLTLFCPSPLLLFDLIAQLLQTSPHLLFYSHLSFSAIFDVVNWSLTQIGKFYQKCNCTLFKQQPFRKHHFHPSYSWFNHTKGNKTSLCLCQTTAFLSIMRQTLAGATLQIICKSPMDIYYLPTINYMCLENVC